MSSIEGVFLDNGVGSPASYNINQINDIVGITNLETEKKTRDDIKKKR